MFEKSLKEKLKRIFDLDKVTFAEPGESQEQECIFIQVEICRARIKDGIETARVNGKLRIFANNEKLPFSYLSKKIAEADLADTKDIFFFEHEENKGQFGNITERSLSFVYFFNSQYNPNLGTITSINIEQVTE